ncbi:MAG: divergent polysaccharide deacetylase family protein [Candidatus Cloacimonetes bacterium]|nr:divergent polysaccharide deacetylase family protein [Candidatus Cloacimonadota bacterium]
MKQLFSITFLAMLFAISSIHTNEQIPSLRSRIKSLMEDYYSNNIKLDYTADYRPIQSDSNQSIKAFLETYLDSLSYPYSILVHDDRSDHFFIQYQVPNWVNLKFLHRKFSRDIFKNCGYSGQFNSNEVGQELEINLQNRQQAHIIFSKNHPRAKVAIIVDDMGYMGKGYRLLKKIPLSITFAVLPFYEQSKVLAKQSYKLGYELMLHMPMQPAKGRAYFDFDHMIKEGLSPLEVQSRTKSLLSSVPLIVGVNNHQGSLSTSNQKYMDIIMQEIKDHSKLYFIDSITSSKSVAFKTAKRLGVPTLKRNYGFLDNDKDQNIIRNNLRGLIKKSYKRKTQIAIMHEKKVSALALMDVIQEFKDAEIEIVSPGDLLY